MVLNSFITPEIEIVIRSRDIVVMIVPVVIIDAGTGNIKTLGGPVAAGVITVPDIQQE